MAMRELLLKVAGARTIGGGCGFKVLCVEADVQTVHDLELNIFQWGARGQRKVEATSLCLRQSYTLNTGYVANITMKQEMWPFRHPNPFS